MKIAVNGSGRIGKNFIRAVLSDPEVGSKFQIAVINVGKADKEALAFSLKYDTLLGRYPGEITYDNGIITIDGSLKIEVIQELNPEKAPWQSHDIDWVVECTGKFTSRDGAQKHINAGARKVLISAPAQDEDITIIPGVNQGDYKRNEHNIVSLGSCTTNAVYPMLKVLQDSFGIENAFMTTVHAYTNTQSLLDVDPSMKDLRRSRAAALNIVPTGTGAMSLVDRLMPELVGKIEGSAMRVPLGKVSLIDLNATLTKKVSALELNEVFKKASHSYLAEILEYVTDPLVSSDFAGSNYSVSFDSLLTKSLGSVVKVFGWYDNEWGYSMRLKDFLKNNA